VEDWEQFFVEKSRRRFDKAERDRRRERTRTAITVALVMLIVVVGIAGLALLP
jgi:hypothetical protein